MRSSRMLVQTLMVLSLSGCYSLGTVWMAQPFVPDQFVVAKQPKRIRITTYLGEQVVLDRPKVRNDSIVGRGSDGVTGVPVEEVRRIETGTSKALETGGRGVGMFVAGALMGVVETASSVPHTMKFNWRIPKTGSK
ncbi:MAG TPA: hypothetical protein VK845_12870 [Gemmatimonadales bacterium]|nr:hypothetical protein [Gemmatimonadales bacterium]